MMLLRAASFARAGLTRRMQIFGMLAPCCLVYLTVGVVAIPTPKAPTKEERESGCKQTDRQSPHMSGLALGALTNIAAPSFRLEADWRLRWVQFFVARGVQLSLNPLLLSWVWVLGFRVAFVMWD